MSCSPRLDADAVGYCDIVLVPRGQILHGTPGASVADPPRWKGEARDRSQLSAQRRYVVCGHEQMADLYRHGTLSRYVQCSVDHIPTQRREALIYYSSSGADTFELLEPYCSEFLVHAADNEGLQKGIDEDLVRNLASWCRIPVTYAGGCRSVDDLPRVEELSNGKVDLTIGSALDIFGGSGVKLDDCIRWNKSKEV